MKSLLAAALLCGVALPAHASLICDAPVQLSGKTGTNPVISSVVWHDGPTWHVIHTLRDGQLIDRSTQYLMADEPNPAGHHGWHGWSNKAASSLWMTGEVFVNGAVVTYEETLHDDHRGDAVVMRSDTTCHQSDAVAPTTVASTPAPTYAPAPAGMRLPIMFGNSGAYVAVSIGTIAANMLVDTGATGMTVSASIADQLIASGQATERPSETVTLAGGIKQAFRQVNISSVTVGGHVVNNVHAGVTPDGSDMLLGLSVLAQVAPKFAINIAANTLDFE
jgi:clan AA aspartic protease (TIGR02281 family)